jgi:hypothetical protein
MPATRKKGLDTSVMVIETDLLLLDGRFCAKEAPRIDSIPKSLRCSPNFSTESRRFR